MWHAGHEGNGSVWPVGSYPRRRSHAIRASRWRITSIRILGALAAIACRSTSCLIILPMPAVCRSGATASIDVCHAPSASITVLMQPLIGPSAEPRTSRMRPCLISAQNAVFAYTRSIKQITLIGPFLDHGLRPCTPRSRLMLSRRHRPPGHQKTPFCALYASRLAMRRQHRLPTACSRLDRRT